MMKFEYCKEGKAISDFDINDFLKYVTDCLNNHRITDMTFKISTSPPFEAIRLAIVEGKIDFNKIQFLFNGRIITINKYGAITDWPDGFCDLSCIMAENILRGAFKIRKAEREHLFDNP